MAITLRFFMIKRGLTVEKMALKSNSKTAKELLDYAKSLDIGVTKEDEILIRDYFEILASTTQSTTHEIPPVLEKRKRGKKKAGNNV